MRPNRGQRLQICFRSFALLLLLRKLLRPLYELRGLEPKFLLVGRWRLGDRSVSRVTAISAQLLTPWCAPARPWEMFRRCQFRKRPETPRSTLVLAPFARVQSTGTASELICLVDHHGSSL